MAKTNSAKEAEAKGQARKASLEDLTSKRPVRKNVTLQSGDETLEVSVQSIGRKAYADLVDACSEEIEQEKVDDEGNVIKDENDEPVTETVERLKEEDFFPALVAASLVDIDVSVDVVKQWVDEWNASEFDELAMAAFEVNTRNKVAVQGKG